MSERTHQVSTDMDHWFDLTSVVDLLRYKYLRIYLEEHDRPIFHISPVSERNPLYEVSADGERWHVLKGIEDLSRFKYLRTSFGEYDHGPIFIISPRRDSPTGSNQQIEIPCQPTKHRFREMTPLNGRVLFCTKCGNCIRPQWLLLEK